MLAGKKTWINRSVDLKVSPTGPLLILGPKLLLQPF